MDELTRRKALNLAGTAGALAGALALGVTAQAQQPDQEAEISDEDLRGFDEDESLPPEGEEGQEPKSTVKWAFVGAPGTFLLSGKYGAVLLNYLSKYFAFKATVREGAQFYYLIVSRSLRFAISKKSGLLGMHAVFIKRGANKYKPFEKAVQKPLAGNLI